MTPPSVLRVTANRAVHLRITPRPANLGESREILRLISHFGEVEYFKNFKYDTLSAPNTAMVIFRDQAAAESCLRRSPIRFRMGRAISGEEVLEGEGAQSHPPESQVEDLQDLDSRQSSRPGPSGAPFGLGQKRSMSTSTATRAAMNSFPEPVPHSPEPLLEPRTFQIQTNRARMNFRDQITVGHYFGTFPIDSKSIAQKALVRSVPIKGLSCVNWKAENKPWRLVSREKKGKIPGGAKMKSLRELYKEGPERGASPRDGSLP